MKLMGLISYLLNNNKAKELEDIIIAYWSKIQNYKNNNIEEENFSDFMDSCLMGFRNRAKIQEPVPIDYHNDGLRLNEIYYAKKGVFIASKEQFQTLNMLCSEIVAKINEYNRITKKMETNISRDVYTVITEFNQFIIKLKYSYKYVVE